MLITASLVWFLGFSKFSPFLIQKIVSPIPETHFPNLQITKPEDGEVLSIEEVEIAGEAKPQTFLAVFNENDSQIFKIGNSGEFRLNLNLNQGFNQIRLINFELNGKSSQKDLELFYLTEKFEESLERETAVAVSEKSQGLIDRLTQLRTKQNLKVVAGVIKGILGRNLALETKSGSKTIQVSPEAQIGIYPASDKKLDFAQIQAQDFVVAIGVFAQQGILTAKILLVNPDNPPIFNKIAKFGILTKLAKNSLELTNPQAEKAEQILQDAATVFDEQNQKIDPAKIEVGNKLVVVGKLEKDKIMAEKILVISGNYLVELEKFTTPPLSTQSATQSAN